MAERLGQRRRIRLGRLEAELAMLVMPLVMMLLMTASTTPVPSVAPVTPPPASGGDHQVKDQRGESNDLPMNGMEHGTLEGLAVARQKPDGEDRNAYLEHESTHVFHAILVTVVVGSGTA